MTEMVDIVDENDSVIRTASRRDVREQRLLHRATKIIIRNKKGEYFVKKRSATKKHYPSMHAVGIGETVQSGETYEQAAKRGLIEELDITAQPRYFFTILFEDNVQREIIHAFQLITDETPHINPKEIERGWFVKERELKKLLNDNFSPSSRATIEEYFRRELDKEDFLEIVDDEDKVVGIGYWEDVFENYTFRSSNVLVFNDKGELFVHQRSNNIPYGGKWDVKVGGCLRIGESYEQGARREVKEEIGVDLETLEFLFKFQFRNGHSSNRAVYKTVHNGPFKLDEHEITQGRFMKFEEIRDMIKNGEMTASAAAIFEKYET